MTNDMDTLGAVARLDNSGEIVVADPFEPDRYHAASDVQSLIRSAFDRKEKRQAEFAALKKMGACEECPEGDIARAPLDAVKALKKAIAEDDEKLKDFDKDVREALLTISGFKAYITQTRGNGTRIDAMSVRGKFADMLKELGAVIEANKPQVPTRQVPILLFATDKGAADLAAKIANGKVSGVTGYKFAPSEADEKKIVKLFDI